MNILLKLEGYLAVYLLKIFMHYRLWRKRGSHILLGLRNFSQKDNKKGRLNFFLDLAKNNIKMLQWQIPKW